MHTTNCVRFIQEKATYVKIATTNRGHPLESATAWGAERGWVRIPGLGENRRR